MSVKQFALLVLLAALWGASFLFMRVAGPEFGPFALIAVRVTLASMVLVPLWLLREPKSGRRAVLTHWRELTVVGLLNSAIPFVLFAYATLYITGGLAAIMNSTATIWTAVVAWIWLSRKPGLRTTVGLVLGLIGVVVLVSDSITAGIEGAGIGALAAAFAAVLYGIAANYATEKLPGVSSLSIATFSLVAASIALIPVAIVFAPAQSISTQAWAAVIAMGIFSTAVANIIYFYLLAAVGSTRTVTVTFMIPIFGSIWGALFIDETITPVMLIGGGIILSGLALVTKLAPRSIFDKLGFKRASDTE